MARPSMESFLAVARLARASAGSGDDAPLRWLSRLALLLDTEPCQGAALTRLRAATLNAMAHAVSVRDAAAGVVAALRATPYPARLMTHADAAEANERKGELIVRYEQLARFASDYSD